MESSQLPIMGICLGHQLLALAAGARTIKLKYGVSHALEALELRPSVSKLERRLERHRMNSTSLHFKKRGSASWASSTRADSHPRTGPITYLPSIARPADATSRRRTMGTRWTATPYHQSGKNTLSIVSIGEQ